MDKTLSEHNNHSEKESAVVTTVRRSASEPEIQAINPHWVKDDPAWDIIIGNVVIKSVTKSQIMQYQPNDGYDRYSPVVLERHIQNLRESKLIVTFVMSEHFA